MKNILFCILLIVFTFSSFLKAQELSPPIFMNKITQRLVGAWPLPSDYELLQKEMKSTKCSTVSCLDSFFRNYIREKMSKPEFYALFYAEVTERFGYKSPPSTSLSQIIISGKAIDNASTGRDFSLIYRTLKENQSFDELYTSQIITDPVYKSNVSAGDSSLERMGIDTSKLSAFNPQPTDYNIKLENNETIAAAEFNLKDHANISGLFTSTRFLTRYWNSPLNQNRKRAAAYFKLMLCDSMSPALERETQKEKELRMALGRSDEQVIVDDIKKIHTNRHATQKDCAMCHSRLDPIGRTMRPLEVGISGEPFKGNLRFYDSTNEIKDIPVKNFHDLIVKTTALPKYLDCQMNWLVEAFLGKDLGLSPRRFSEVIDGVEKKKRRIKTVIEDLLMIPEFRGLSKKAVEPASLVAAKAVLSNCTECHSNTFSLRPEQMKSRLARVAVCLDLPQNGKSMDMPPSDHYWQPSKNEVMAVKNWIQQGAPIEEGIHLFERTEIERIFAPNKEAKKCRE